MTVVMLMTLGMVALAQRPGGQGLPRQLGMGRLSLVAVPVEILDTSLKLSADQKSKIADIQAKYREEARALRPAQGGPPNPAATRENMQKIRQLAEQANQQIQAALNNDQKAKVPALLEEFGALQTAGIPLPLLPELKLTDDQKKQILEVAKTTRDQVQAMSREERRAKGRQMMMEARTKINNILTGVQKAAIEKWNRENPRRRQGGGARP
jgi:Spy/CpxP family protein refolding chaperone